MSERAKAIKISGIRKVFELGATIKDPIDLSIGQPDFTMPKEARDEAHLAIDQGPIVVMLENYRTGLIWKLFMNIPDIQKGLKKLGFRSPYFEKQP